MKTVNFEGKILELQQDAYVSDCGDFYTALAIDSDGNEYRVQWDVIKLDMPITDESESCDWDKYTVTAI